MPYARYVAALLCLALVGCSESEGSSEGTLESSFVADGGRVIGPRDDSTDPAVTLLHGDDSGAPAPEGDGDEPPPIVDAGTVDADAPVAPDEPDAAIADSGTEPDPPVTEPDPPDDGNGGNGGLVGTVCDLLGGLLCPIGLLCVEGLCQEPAND